MNSNTPDDMTSPLLVAKARARFEEAQKDDDEFFAKHLAADKAFDDSVLIMRGAQQTAMDTRTAEAIARFEEAKKDQDEFFAKKEAAYKAFHDSTLLMRGAHVTLMCLLGAPYDFPMRAAPSFPMRAAPS